MRRHASRTNQRSPIELIDDAIREITWQPKIGMIQYTEMNVSYKKTVARCDSTLERIIKIGNASTFLIIGPSSNPTRTGTWMEGKVKTRLHDLSQDKSLIILILIWSGLEHLLKLVLRIRELNLLLHRF